MSEQRNKGETAVLFNIVYKLDLKVRINYKHNFEIEPDMLRLKQYFEVQS